ENHDEFGSTAEWPDSESPDANPSAIRNAGHRRNGRSSSHERNTNAATRAKPSVIATNATPKRVLFANGERSPYMRSTNGSWSASSARRMNAAMPTSIAANAPRPENR